MATFDTADGWILTFILLYIWLYLWKFLKIVKKGETLIVVKVDESVIDGLTSPNSPKTR